MLLSAHVWRDGHLSPSVTELNVCYLVHIERIPLTDTIPPLNPNLIGVATDTGVNVRGGPSKGYPSLAEVQAGAELTLLARYEM